MKPYYLVFPLLFLCGISLPAQQPENAIRLKNGSLATGQELIRKKLNHPSWKESMFGQKHYVVLQFIRMPDAAMKKELQDDGISLFQYLPGQAYLAELAEGVGADVLRLHSVREAYRIPAALKISRNITDMSPATYAVSCFGSLDRSLVLKEIEQTGATVVNTKIQPAGVVFIRAAYPVLTKIAHLPFVAFINPQRLKDIPLNNNNRAIHGVDALACSPGRNLQGQNVVLGIGDNADPSGHIDFAGRLILRTTEPIDYHGTHTTGTMGGAGILNPRYKGMAPKSRIIVNAFSDIIVNAPVYINDYNMVASNNSYYNGADNCPGDGDYDPLSNYLDAQSQDLPSLLTVFAAGNDGLQTCSTYPSGFATIKSGFQTSKNVLTVGANDNVTYGSKATSSRGPTNDGRIKPEIVCGGQNITSTIPYNMYDVYSGTSMAAPTATGIMGLLYERYRQLHAGANPPAALIKAVATNSADDFGNPGPDFAFGFGMLNARTAVECLEQNHYFTGSTNTGGNDLYTISGIPAGAQQIKVMLYWPDAAASPFAASALVNDLDLTVSTSTGILHYPLILDPSPAGVNNNATEGSDHLNNIEQVVINNPPAGTCTVTVKGFNVPSGPQPYIVAYEIINPSVTVEYPFGTETFVAGETETIRWSAYGGDPNSFTLEYSPDGGASWNTVSNSIPATSRSYVWTVPLTPTTQGLMRVTRNTTGYSDMSDLPFIITGQPLLTVTNPCAGYAQLAWNSIPGATRYEVMELKTDSMQVIASTTDTTYLVSGLINDSSYWFSTRAVINSSAGRRALGVRIIPFGGSCAANNLQNDLSADSIVAPVTGRMFTSSQPGNSPISIAFRNAGPVPTAAPISFSFQVNNGPIVTEIYPGSLPAGYSGIHQFAAANSYDFSAPGSYTVRAWLHMAGDTIPENDTLKTIVKNLRNDPLTLSPSFTEGFESALAQTYNGGRNGLDSLDRADFSATDLRGRLSTFFNSGFPRTGSRCATLDVTDYGAVVADSFITTFNLSNYTASDQLWLDLYYKKQSVLPNANGNRIWIRGDEHAAWIQVKNLSDAADPAGSYSLVNLDVTGILSEAVPVQTVSSSFQVKCGSEGGVPAASNLPGANPGGGISFDDFTFTKSLNDAGLIAVLQPALRGACNFSNAEPVVLTVRNYSTDTLYNVPVTYASNADTVTEIIPFLPPRDTLVYTFTQKADLSAYQAQLFRAWVNYAGDNYHSNDSSAQTVFQTTPLISSYPYLEGFENNNGYWFSGGTNNSWQWGKPAKTVINKAANGSKAWVTNLTGNYNDNEYSFLYSPCFDLSGLTRPVLSFSHIFQTEDDCSCDFHWVEYSLDDTVWNILGSAGSGTNWYDDAAVKAWQLSDTRWHVSSYDIPVNPAKIRFRMVMYSDPGTNYEGVAIDDVHIFDKAPVYTDSIAIAPVIQSISGSGWNDVELNGKRIVSINPNGQDLGSTYIRMWIDTAAIRDTAGQDYGARNLVILPANTISQPVGIRFYFTDSEANRLIFDTACPSCTRPFDAYESGITQYSSKLLYEDDSTLRNNVIGSYIYHIPQQDVQIIPYDNGYYAEYQVNGFSEFWINGGGKSADHPLAAWLKSFTAVKAGVTGVLNWTSWQEVNTNYFFVERSTDSISFVSIGTVPARPHLDSTTDYTFTDKQLANGNNYYRLVLVFSNGDSVFSPVRQLSYSVNNPVFSVSPNPTSDQLTVTTADNCNDIQLFDVTGRLVLSKITTGLQQTISLETLPRGVYMLKVDTDSGTKVVKVERR
jgi:Subtilase family/Secretion system C-terminal sorting domain